MNNIYYILLSAIYYILLSAYSNISTHFRSKYDLKYMLGLAKSKFKNYLNEGFNGLH